MITDETLEAAALAIYRANRKKDVSEATYEAKWARHRFGYTVLARAALEAAAPHLMAQAWDEGYKAAMFDKEYYSHNTNPYRSNPVAEQPARTICETCGGDGSQGNDCTCPGWISVGDLAHADLKAILANDDLSLGVPHEKEL